jgi:hypothetical protein
MEIGAKSDEDSKNILGSVLAQLVPSKNLAAYFQMSPSAPGSQFGSRARRYNISRARRSVKLQ